MASPSTNQTAYVGIYIGGVKQNQTPNQIPYEIPLGGRITPQYSVLNGPVHIVSNINVFASERVHNATGFINEVMGIPNNKLTTQYWFPRYDNLTMQSWILVGNPSTTQTAHVDIYIGGVKQNQTPKQIPYEIPPGGRITPTFPVLNGPVHIVSVIDVFASERVHTGQGFVNEARHHHRTTRPHRTRIRSSCGATRSSPSPPWPRSRQGCSTGARR